MARSLDTETPLNPALDSSVQPFLQADFDPATYLNNTLPPLTTSSNTSRASYNNALSLTEVALQAQTLLSRLSSQTTRLSNALTQLTDEIVRSGGRLAYEVELLRGEAIGLWEALENGLKHDFEVFVPKQGQASISDTADGEEQGDAKDGLADIPISKAVAHGQPQFISRLHTLAAVRERLDSVIKLFDEAMKWPVTPVDSSTTSTSLISVTAPMNNDEVRDLEAKAKQFVDNLRQELNALTRQDNDGDLLALERVQRLEAVADVWKGTSEEKVRSKIVTDLRKLVDDQRRVGGRVVDDSTSRPTMDYRYGDTKVTSESSYGFLNNLRNLKNEVYLD